MKLGFFFGAGAEVSYGLPLGGKFAIDLFRQDSSAEKEAFRKALLSINDRTAYATEWLPNNYLRKRIHAFGKSEFKSLIESSIEYKRSTIIRMLNEFDAISERALTNCGVEPKQLHQAFKLFCGKDYGAETYSQSIKINPTLSDNIKLFESEFYSAVLDVIRMAGDTSTLEKYAASILQLLIGAYGQEMVQKVNQEIFTEAPDDLQIFDDISGMFRLEFDRVGSTALDLLFRSGNPVSISEQSSIHDILLRVLQEVVELLFSEILDYQALIDSHWRYLYSPREDWAKFTKMVIFLMTTRSYMMSKISGGINPAATGYYHDLLDIVDLGYSITGIGTSNYNNLIEDICGEKIDKSLIYHLNGNVNDFYSPYKNTVIRNGDGVPPESEIFVPFMLTQSGIKPLTSINMSRRYVDLFDGLLESDAIIAIGYNFNVDDNHINGLFRQLLEDEGKSMIWVRPADAMKDLDIKKMLEKKMRLPTSVRDRIHILRVDRITRATENGEAWIGEISKILGAI